MQAIGLRTEIEQETGAATSRTAVTYPSAGDTAGPRGTFALTILAIYVYLLVSRVLDVSPIWFLHIPLLLLIVLTIILLARGGVQELFSLKIVKWFAACTVWVIVASVFSMWRGASLNYVQTSVEGFAVFLIVLQIPRTRQEWQKLAGAYAYATLTASILSFYLARSVAGRLALDNGSFADPNEFALILAVGLPFWWLKASRATGFRKALFFLCTIPILIAFARTGSRAGLLCLATIFVVVLFFASMTQRMLMCVFALAMVVLGAMFLPSYLKMRFTTFFQSDNISSLDAKTQFKIEADLSSTAAREQLLRQGIRISLQHPLLGVGPGVFAYVAWDQRKAETGVGGWAQVNHNTYLQMSSETGIPGLIFFAGTVFLCIRYTLADYRRLIKSKPELATIHLYLFTTLTSLAVGIFFLSEGYSNMLAIMFALAAGLHRIAEARQEEGVLESPVPAQTRSGMAPIMPRAAAPARAPKRSPFRFGRRRVSAQNSPSRLLD
ncbi:MAG TPA: O-antigen ligase family protein [Bryobacteraceae bacterium]|jgi:O-antigen ligase|nr:O-antigen ligase family protein [Bryobacteraceae bacterium]